jgi:uncharacterized pyridoxamine 5'-phosphate oxidase family protein
MKEINEFLAANPMGCLATEDNGKPQVRPWGFMFEQEGKFWFCTSNDKHVFRQLKLNPAAAFSFTSKEMVTVRLNGNVVFSDDMAIKKKVLDSNEMVKSVYKTPDNPTFEVFCLEHGTAVMSDFSGQPPKVFEF